MVTNLHVCVSVWSIIIVYHSLCTDVPSAPVIMNHSTFCKNLSVSWFPDKFSNIVSYTIVVVNSTEAILTTLNFPGDASATTFQDLRGGSNYTISITACNLAGCNSSSVSVYVPECKPTMSTTASIAVALTMIIMLVICLFI